jgi:hypothetical protein
MMVMARITGCLLIFDCNRHQWLLRFFCSVNNLVPHFGVSVTNLGCECELVVLEVAVGTTVCVQLLEEIPSNSS